MLAHILCNVYKPIKFFYMFYEIKAWVLGIYTEKVVVSG